jgi:hypothetical protein
VCDAGACVDPCKGAVCPLGQTCAKGACVNKGAADAGADGGARVSFGSGDASSGAAGGSTDAGSDATVETDDAGEPLEAGDIASSPSKGCSCRAAGDAGRGDHSLFALAAASFLGNDDVVAATLERVAA